MELEFSPLGAECLVTWRVSIRFKTNHVFLSSFQLEQMDLEVREIPPQSRGMYSNRMRSYKQEMGKLETDFVSQIPSFVLPTSLYTKSHLFFLNFPPTPTPSLSQSAVSALSLGTCAQDKQQLTMTWDLKMLIELLIVDLKVC